MKYDYKIACFTKHCPTCKYEAVKEEDDPCNECLDYPVNLNIDKPVKWEERALTNPNLHNFEIPVLKRKEKK